MHRIEISPWLLIASLSPLMLHLCLRLDWFLWTRWGEDIKGMWLSLLVVWVGGSSRLSYCLLCNRMYPRCHTLKTIPWCHKNAKGVNHMRDMYYFKCYFPKRLYKALHWELRQGHMNVNMPNMFSFGFHCRCFMPGKSFVAILDRQICCFWTIPLKSSPNTKCQGSPVKYYPPLYGLP